MKFKSLFPNRNIGKKRVNGLNQKISSMGAHYTLVQKLSFLLQSCSLLVAYSTCYKNLV